MAYEQPLFCDGNEIADVDLTTKQFYAVKLTATGYNLCGAGEDCHGFLQNDPDINEVCSVMVEGVSKAVAAEALAKGAKVTSNAAGKLVAAIASDSVIGTLKEASAADGDIVSVLINRFGVSMNDTNETADADLTTKQYYAVKLTATGYALCGAGEPCDGFLQNAPDITEVCDVQTLGVSQVVVAAALAKGAKVTPDAAGKLVAATTGDFIIGTLKEASAADGDVVSMLINRYGVSA